MLGELEQKVNSEPTNPKVRREYAVALYATGDLTKALEQYLEEQKYNAEDSVLYNNIGNIYRDQGKFENAVTSYKKAIELNKQLTNAYINLANLYIYSMDKLEEGINVYKDAIKEYPDNVEIYLLLANTYEQSGESKKAKEVFSQVLTKDPNNQAAKLGLERIK
jgi:tetratricopeptide (TPR) repeat protein